jgi:hypothetical protein
MAIVARYNRQNQVVRANLRSLNMMLGDFGQRVSARLEQAITAGQIETWDDPSNITLLNTRLDALTAKPVKDENDLVTIAAICAVLTNFVEEEV